jgi:hypothetical protein
MMRVVVKLDEANRHGFNRLFASLGMTNDDRAER